MKIHRAILAGFFTINLISAAATAQEPQTASTPAATNAIVQGELTAESNSSAAENAQKTAQTASLSDEEAAVVPYYNNFMKAYRLGPQDVISVEVFGQPNYSKMNITVPPDGTISYPLIRDGVFVAGKTRQQIADEITKKLDEFIIDPKVTVSLDKAMSKRYSVLGDVGKPGVQVMERKLSVYEAIAEAGGILPTGNKKEVVVLRSSADGKLSPITVSVEVKKPKKGEKAVELQMVYLEPGDQVIVQGNKIKAWQQVMNMLPIVGFARGLLTGGF